MTPAPRIIQGIRNATIRGKLILIIAATCGAGVLAAGIANFAFQAYSLRLMFARDITALAGIVANNLAGPVAFDDAIAAREVLDSLKAKPQIDSAIVTKPTGSVLAQTGMSEARLESRSAGSRFVGWRFEIVSPVAVAQETVGFLRLGANFRPTFLDALWLSLTAMVGIGIGSFAAALGVGYGLQGLIVQPLLRLSAAAGQIGSQRDYCVRVEKLGHDELGKLTDAFNEMLDRLQAADGELRRANQALTTEIQERRRLQSELVEASRLAGMADVATGVLHNVGNVLNSVNVSVGVIREQLRDSRLPLLTQTTALIRQQEPAVGAFFTNDDRGRRIPAFLTMLAAQITDEHARLSTELVGLTSNVEHIKEIVAMQQNYAKAYAVLEEVDAVQLMDQALSIHRQGLERHRVAVQRNFPAAAQPITTDRHKILQILTNFVANAVQATKTNPPDRRTIVLGVRCLETAEYAFTVGDNGVGIPRENLPKLFQQGFTTRADGHGFGLHSGALIASSLGGAIDVVSDGPGTGATFTLRLPPHAPANAKATS